MSGDGHARASGGRRERDGTATAADVGVWDDAPIAEVTATLSASAVTLWRKRLSETVTGAAAQLHANLSDIVSSSDESSTIADLRAIHGSAVAGDALPRADVVSAATMTAAHVARAVRCHRLARGTAQDHHIVTFASLHAIARARGHADQDVVRAMVIAAATAAALSEIFMRAGTLAPGRARATVATLASGMGVSLLRGAADDESHIAHVLGLLASCSVATGPTPTHGDAWILVLAKAAGNAVLAELLVVGGFTSNPRALEAGRGLLPALTGTKPPAPWTHVADLRQRPLLSAITGYPDTHWERGR